MPVLSISRKATASSGRIYVRLSVRDSGPGMSPDVVRRALDPVFSTRSGHKGWGLAECAGFVRQCGGEIMLSSVKNQGSAANIYLPRISN